MKVRAVSAHVTNPNTPESDQLSEVWHTVTLSDGNEWRIMATDPVDAINRINEDLSCL
jgi:hypothetical protein